MRERLAAVRDRIERAAARAGRKASEVKLVAVSKTFPAAAVREAFAAGLREFGENKVQEAEAKVAALQDLREAGARFHLVGHLQSNKARKAVATFDRIHSVDSIELGRKLDQMASELGRSLQLLVQVDLGREETKFGLDEQQLLPTLEALRGLKSVHVDGLMTMPPASDDPEAARAFFRRLREHRDQAVRDGLLEGGELSMGMSHDLEVAIEEGATFVRVGTALFGDRTKPTA